MADKPTPGRLYKQAEGDPDRYIALMVEHGYLVPGIPKPLPCGWSPRSKDTPAPVNQPTRERTGAAEGVAGEHVISEQEARAWLDHVDELWRTDATKSVAYPPGIVDAWSSHGVPLSGDRQRPRYQLHARLADGTVVSTPERELQREEHDA